MDGSLNKRVLFISNYCDNEMYCFRREMGAPKRLIDSKAWCPLSILLGTQDKNSKNSIKPNNYPKSKTLRELEKLDID